ncbi:MAG TPA: O-antigen ligase family protein [Sphingomicrobium sp.]|jgi:O-antigen ligase
MSTLSSDRPLRWPSVAFVLFCVFLATLWLAGGATRADVFGQVVVRVAAALALIALALFGDAPVIARARPIWWLLLTAILLAVVQLIPLPPSIWHALPERALIAEATRDQSQPWRSLAIVPGTTLNALASLIVPLVILCLATGIRPDERGLLPGVIFVMIAASGLLGLVQISGVGFNNPFINESAGAIGSSFANRNHFALLLALGCLQVPAWVFVSGHRLRGRALIGVGVSVLFLLSILATGSRGGLLLGAVALIMGVLIARGTIKHALGQAPRWALPAVIAAVVALIIAVMLLSVAADRAVSIQRAIDIDARFDMRSRALPTIWAMTLEYFPFGAGLGSFDPMFRIHEPLPLLKPTYFNHAHNDLLEVVLDAGIPGLLLLATALAWWGWAGLRVWRSAEHCSGADWSEAGDPDGNANPLLARIGSAMLLLILLASAFDYPARTPIMMALIIVAALWLHDGAPSRRG